MPVIRQEQMEMTGIPIVVARQGGDADDWTHAVAPLSTYTPEVVHAQCGAKEWEDVETPASAGTLAVTYPETWPVGVPLPFAIAAGTNAINVGVIAETNSGFTITWKDIDGETHSYLEFFWWAVGPETE